MFCNAPFKPRNIEITVTWVMKVEKASVITYPVSIYHFLVSSQITQTILEIIEGNTNGKGCEYFRRCD